MKENSVSLRLSASMNSVVRGKGKEHHFALELNSAIFDEIRDMNFT